MPFVHKFLNQQRISLLKTKKKGKKGIYFNILKIMIRHLNLFGPLSIFQEFQI